MGLGDATGILGTATLMIRLEKRCVRPPKTFGKICVDIERKNVVHGHLSR
jgi:hypothetical protein